MKKSNSVVLTTVFPASELYLSDFFDSLRKQTINDFDIIVVNDGISNFISYKRRYSELNIIEIEAGNSPAKNREIGINKALSLGYENLIFGDSDDYFSTNRILDSVIALSKYDFVFNELTIISEKQELKNFLKSNNIDAIKAIDCLLESNVFGLSNTAIKSKLISNNLDLDKDLMAVDWFLFSTILLDSNYSVSFLNDVITYYRQHSDNAIGMDLLLTEKKLQIGLGFKETHYNSLVAYYKRGASSASNIELEKAIIAIAELKEALKEPNFRKDYIDTVNDNYKQIFTGWWSEIITLEKYYEYKN